MAVKAMYNSLARQYSIADSFGSISESHQCALNQIEQNNINFNNCSILDLGINDGIFLQNLTKIYNNIKCTGIYSTELLHNAQKILPLNIIKTSVAEANLHVPLHSQNLVLAHFIDSQVNINTLFEQAKLLTTENGYFSMITSTYESFPVAQQYLANFIARDSLLSGFVGHYYKSVVKNSAVATGEEELLKSIHTHGFHVVEHARLQIPVVFHSIDELSLFGIDGAWFLNALAISMLPKNFLLQRIKRVFGKIFTFPYQDTHVIDILLVKK